MEINDKNANFFLICFSLIYYTSYYWYVGKLSSDFMIRIIFKTLHTYLYLYYDYWTFFYLSTFLWLFSWYLYIGYGIYV